MPAYKDKAKGTWYASFYFENWTGKKEKKMKRGFKTKREALEWERTFLQQQTADLDMTFESFVALYAADMKGRIKENTWGTKEHILYKKLVPYFGKRKMSEIHSKEVMAWQSEMLNYRDKNGKPYSPVYLKTLHNQLSAVFNHAVKHYKLKANPAAQVGNMGKAKGREMLFWTKAEYLKFADAMMDKPLSYYAFEMLYWCGIREGELLALTPGDFDFEKQTVSISKSYQRIKGQDVVTDPKTAKSNRVIQMPAFLCEEMEDYIKSLYAAKPTDRIFPVTKSYLHREMDRGAKEAGVKRIRIHDLRHSHISLLIDMGFTALAIADRVGHESIDITYRYAHLFPTRQAEMADKLERIAANYGLKLRHQRTSMFQNHDEVAEFSTREEITARINEVCTNGRNLFRTEPTGYDKFYYFDEGTFAISFFTTSNLTNTGTYCYLYNSPYGTLSSGFEIFTEVEDVSAFSSRTHTTPDGMEITVLQNGSAVYAYVYLDNSFVTLQINQLNGLTDTEVDSIIDMIDFSVIG